MGKTVIVKCRCGAVFSRKFFPDSWPKDKISRGWGRCPHCKKIVQYEIVNFKSHSWYK